MPTVWAMSVIFRGQMSVLQCKHRRFGDGGVGDTADPDDVVLQYYDEVFPSVITSVLSSTVIHAQP